MEFEIREERSSDHAEVDAIQRAAFGGPGEAELVAVLREAANPQLSLVAERGGEIVGHVFFSPIEIEGPETSPPCAGLAPLAVLPERQSEGAGSALVRAGLCESAALGWQAVFLLGDPAYYERFGFHLAAPHGLHYESEVFDSAFQVLELVPGCLSGCRGWVRYHSAFADL